MIMKKKENKTKKDKKNNCITYYYYYCLRKYFAKHINHQYSKLLSSTVKDIELRKCGNTLMKMQLKNMAE